MAVSVAEGAFGQLGLQGEGTLGHIALARGQSVGDFRVGLVLSADLHRLCFQPLFGLYKDNGFVFIALKGVFGHQDRHLNGFDRDRCRDEHPRPPVAFGIGEHDAGNGSAGLFTDHWPDVGDNALGILHPVPCGDDDRGSFPNEWKVFLVDADVHPDGTEIGNDKGFGIIFEHLTEDDMLADHGAIQGSGNFISRV